MTGSLQIKGDKYYAVLNFKDQSGKRVQKWISLDLPVKGNTRKAEAALAELMTTYQGFEIVEPMNTLLSRHIMAWIEANRPNVAKTTYDQYINMLNLHITPYFDSRGITVSKLTAGDLEDYYNTKVSEGLSPNTVIKHHAIIRTALQWAVKHRYIRENVADFADKPSRARYHGAEPYSVEEVAMLLQCPQIEPIAVPIFLASFYGLRRSEILGLRWSAIEFQKGTISISTTVVREKDGDHIRTAIRDETTKTEYSMRMLPLCPYTYQYFAALLQRQQEDRVLCGNCYDMRFTDFVCVDRMGALRQPDFISQKFQQVLEKYGLRRIRFHDLRHSCATIMLYLGYTLKDIQTWLGHSNYNFTADTYVHSAAGVHEAMANTLSERLEELLPQNFNSETDMLEKR
jgi:integrase